jgi:phycocyanobilin lyase subunit beta
MTDTNLAQKLITAVDEADSSPKLLEAVQNLAAASLVETVPNLIAALGYNNPGAAVAAVDGLIAIGEPSVEPLLELIDNYNYGARAWAVRALAGIGDPKALDTLLDAAKNDFALSVRRAAARGLGIIKWHSMESSKVQLSQIQVLEALISVCGDPEWVVRYAAVTGLEGLALTLSESPSESNVIPRILTQLSHMADTNGEIAITARVKYALQKLQEGVGIDSIAISS